MKSARGIYFVGVLSMVYSLPTIKYAATTGQLWSGVLALLPLIGAVGLFLRRSWARFPIYAFSVYVVKRGLSTPSGSLRKRAGHTIQRLWNQCSDSFQGFSCVAAARLVPGSYTDTFAHEKPNNGFHRASEIRPCFALPPLRRLLDRGMLDPLNCDCRLTSASSRRPGRGQ